MAIERARLEMAGEFFQVWQWQLGAEFAPSSADNSAANTASSSCKVDPTTSLRPVLLAYHTAPCSRPCWRYP